MSHDDGEMSPIQPTPGENARVRRVDNNELTGAHDVTDRLWCVQTFGFHGAPHTGSGGLLARSPEVPKSIAWGLVG